MYRRDSGAPHTSDRDQRAAHGGGSRRPLTMRPGPGVDGQTSPESRHCSAAVACRTLKGVRDWTGTNWREIAWDQELLSALEDVQRGSEVDEKIGWASGGAAASGVSRVDRCENDEAPGVVGGSQSASNAVCLGARLIEEHRTEKTLDAGVG